MWAAANSSSRIGSQVYHPNNTDSDTSWDSESSDERSTTESIHESGKADEISKPSVDEHKKRSQRHRMRKKKKRRREETPEAAMARLTSSYSAAMGAVGALHRVSRQIWRDNSSKKSMDMDVEAVKCDDMGVRDGNDGEESPVGENGKKTNPEQDTNAECEMQVDYDAESPETDTDNNATRKLEEAHMTIEKVAQSARSTLEQSLLLDPIILAPILLPPSSFPRGTPKGNIRRNFTKTDNIPVEQMSSAWWTARHKADSTRVGFDKQASVAKWEKLSAAHKSTVKQIAYLSLVNYADLLLCGCSCCHSCDIDVLDRRPVQSLDALQLFQTDDNTQHSSHCSSCLWSYESREQTLRLALASYCDASELDPSDPTLWFKVACTARSLGRVVDSDSSTSSALIGWRPRSYRSLERLALERGLKSLPKGAPPNRMIMKAWREMEKWDHCQSGQVTVGESDSVVHNESSGSPKQPVELVIHLPKYSWTTLGRILIRACKEGAGYGRRSGPAVSHVWSTNCTEPEDYEFASPLIDIRISPILSLSHVALVAICEYLGKDSNDVKGLACTCKALPAEIQTAISTINIQGDTDVTNPCVNAGKNQSEEAESSTPAASEKVTLSDVDNHQAEENPHDGSKVTDVTEANANATQASAPKKKRRKSKAADPFFIGRASKRVQSQMLSSEKETERQAKRSSVEYCFLAATLSCTSQNPHYARVVKSECNWDNLPVFTSCSNVMTSSTSGRSNDALTSNQTGNALLETSYSLGFFVDKARCNNSGPKHFLELFLLHVATNLADVFGNNKGDLATCVLDCIDLLTGGNQQPTETGLGWCWYGNELVDVDAANLDSTLQAFSINLLSAELRLRRVELDLEFQHDGSILASNVPALLQVVAAISSTNSTGKHERMLLELECRCYWLASAYYFWLSRCSSDSLVSNESEQLGMDYLSKAHKCLFIGHSSDNQSSVSIRTPHLQSSAREGLHWSVLSCQSLSAYHEQLQSSSVVSRARKEFLVVHQSAQGNLTSDHEAKLGNIGTELFDWYWKGNETSKGNYAEIIKDFILHHQDLFEKRVQPVPESTTTASDWSEFYWGEELWNCVPSSKLTSIACTAASQPSRSSIIQVLICSLFATDKHISSNLVIFTKLTLAALELRSRLLTHLCEDTVTSNQCEAEARLHNNRQDEQFLTVTNFFLDKLIYCLNGDSCPESLDAIEMFNSEDLISITFESLRVLSADTRIAPSLSCIRLMQLLSQLMMALKAKAVGLDETARVINSVYFVGLAKIFVNLRSDYLTLKGSDNDKRTKSWQSQVTRKADLIAHIANELAECISLHPSKVSSDGALMRSLLVKALAASTKNDVDDISPFVKLSEASIWFWKHVNNISDKTDAVRVRLLKPIAAVVISLCGTNEIIPENDCCKSFSDYFESDDSINGAFLADDEEEDILNQESKVILRKLSQAVQCISLVYSVAEKAACHEYARFMCPSHQHGPILPLVVIRTLSSLSDNLFNLFSEDAWDEEYPYGARSCGTCLDNILTSAYRSVYGFSVVGQNQTADVSVDRTYLPESIEASSQLFRCIRRLYYSNRRSLPTKALELIERTLPPSQLTPVSSAIHDFLFSVRKDAGLSQLMSDKPLNFPDWILTDSREKDTESQQRETDRLRKMVSSELAKGSITHLDSNQASSADEDGGCLSRERELTRNHEISLFNKFRVVLDDLSNDPTNIEGWVVLSETCGFKADIICDRLVSLNQTFTPADFRPMPSSLRSSPAAMKLYELKRSQLDEFNKTREKWVPYIGNDLHVYIKYPWSSFTSLQACSKDIESKLSNSDECSLWRELETKFEEGNYVAWAQDWAGMFVSALRAMKVRALCVARYLAKTQQQHIDMHPSEVCEDIGTALYGDLIGSTSYGYPIHPMTAHEKREIAQHAKHFFEEAVELSSSGDFSCKSKTVLWENQFMIGKCLEKIASTLLEEKFDGSDQPATRNYETSLTSAIQAYSSALADARTREQSGTGKTETGGSSHGSLEVFYRIHACRYKALLYAIRRVKEELNLAELEALRIANLAWFGDSSSNQTSDELRLKVWDAFVDCVKGLMQCRIEEPKFHRAHFRLAQAINWAPFFYNPDSSLDGLGNEGIPSMNGICIPGHKTGSCKQNAALVIENLFDKRRSQLCAVWVTTSTTPPPFEVLNDSVRKYDYLRLKYIKAFIDCMLVCRQRDKIENLLTNAMSGAQDLAGFYKASAAVRGGDPGRHNKQSLLQASGFLAEVKLAASKALAELIHGDLIDLKRNGVDERGKQLLKENFKLAYALFLRLNSTPNVIVQHMRTDGPIIQVIVLCKCHISIQAGYRINDSVSFEELDSDTLLSFVEQALQRAKEMFPAKSKPQTNKS